MGFGTGGQHDGGWGLRSRFAMGARVVRWEMDLSDADQIFSEVARDKQPVCISSNERKEGERVHAINGEENPRAVRGMDA